jgi:hypothetical protein
MNNERGIHGSVPIVIHFEFSLLQKHNKELITLIDYSLIRRFSLIQKITLLPGILLVYTMDSLLSR